MAYHLDHKLQGGRGFLAGFLLSPQSGIIGANWSPVSEPATSHLHCRLRKLCFSVFPTHLIWTPTSLRATNYWPSSPHSPQAPPARAPEGRKRSCCPQHPCPARLLSVYRGWLRARRHTPLLCVCCFTPSQGGGRRCCHFADEEIEAGTVFWLLQVTPLRCRAARQTDPLTSGELSFFAGKRDWQVPKPSSQLPPSWVLRKSQSLSLEPKGGWNWEAWHSQSQGQSP